MNTSFTEKCVELNGNTISYTDSGKEGKTALVFIHAFGLNKTMWIDQQAFFSQDYRVITFDVRGHGKSGTGDGQYSIDLFVEDLICLLDHLKIQEAVLCGLSMGGYIALRAVGLFPDRVKALVLCDTNCYADSNKEKERRFKLVSQLKSKGTTEFAAQTAMATFQDYSRNFSETEIGWVINAIKENSTIGLCGTLLAIACRIDTSECLKKIEVPTLIISGEKDKNHLPLDSQYLNHFIAGSQLVLIPGAGELSNMENPGEFNSCVQKFIIEKILKLKVGDREIPNQTLIGI